MPLILFLLPAPCPRLRALGLSHLTDSVETPAQLAGASPHFPGVAAEKISCPGGLGAPVGRGDPMEPRSLSLWPGFHWPSMQAFLQATAETRAAPLPLPSSDSMKVISQLGVSLRTLEWNRSLKLNRRIELPFFFPPFRLHPCHPSIYRRLPDCSILSNQA